MGRNNTVYEEFPLVAKSKSYRKPNISRDTLERARAELKGGAVTVAESTSAPVEKAKARAKAPVSAGRRIPTTEELKQEYKYVLAELRNLLVLAGVLFLFIIVTALILPPIA